MDQRRTARALPGCARARLLRRLATNCGRDPARRRNRWVPREPDGDVRAGGRIDAGLDRLHLDLVRDLRRSRHARWRAHSRNEGHRQSPPSRGVAPGARRSRRARLRSQAGYCPEAPPGYQVRPGKRRHARPQQGQPRLPCKAGSMEGHEMLTLRVVRVLAGSFSSLHVARTDESIETEWIDYPLPPALPAVRGSAPPTFGAREGACWLHAGLTAGERAENTTRAASLGPGL